VVSKRETCGLIIVATVIMTIIRGVLAMQKSIWRWLKTLVLIGLLIFGISHYETLAPKAITLFNTGKTNLVAALSGDLSSKLVGSDETNQTAESAETTGHQKTTTATKQTTVSGSATTKTGTMTPVESIVQNTKLSRTYYYSFDSDLPQAGREVFQEAVATYNKTGIVHLVAGKAGSHQNSVTFSMYHKQESADATTLELGHGGPVITKSISIRGTQYWNNAKASLNGSYSTAFSKAVAVHELGHALGLDHSQSTLSVMYPVSQGRTALAAADIASLKTIYQVKS